MGEFLFSGLDSKPLEALIIHYQEPEKGEAMGGDVGEGRGEAGETQ